jgi:uncharacterized membrane protein YvbJ
MAKFCQECGTRYANEGAKYCHNCGKSHVSGGKDANFLRMKICSKSPILIYIVSQTDNYETFIMISVSYKNLRTGG